MQGVVHSWLIELKQGEYYEQHEGVKLDLNESPYPPPPRVVEEACKAAGTCNRYPPPRLRLEVKKLLAEYVGVKPENIYVAPGSDSILKSLYMITVQPGDKVVTPFPCFAVYPLLSKIYGASHITVNLVEDDPWRLDLDLLVKEASSAKLVLIDNPNNPTGAVIVDRDAVSKILKSTKGLVVVDEAYYEFSGETVADLAVSNPRLVVVRTMSKAFSMAGFRVGYAVAHESLVEVLEKTSFPFDLAYPSLAAAKAALEDPGYVKRVVDMIRRERERVRSELLAAGLKAYKSYTNFLLVKAFPRAVEKLREKGVLVRGTPLGDNYFRVTIGRPWENDFFLKVVKELANSGPQ